MKLKLQKHAAYFRYKQKDILFHFWVHTSGEIKTIDTVIFLGSGQWGRVAMWVAGNAPAGTAIVEGLPHKEADRSAGDLKEFAQNYTSTALLAVLDMYKISSVNIIAESQAVPGAVWMALSHFGKISNVALIGPLGFTAHLLGDTPKSRLRQLKRRGFLSALQFAQSPLYDSRNFYLSTLVLNVLLFDARWNISGQKYAVGASHDIRQECRALAKRLHQKGNTMTLILGERDKIFPPHEIKSALKEVDVRHVTSIVLGTSHASLAIRDGRYILSKAVEAVRLRQNNL